LTKILTRPRFLRAKVVEALGIEESAGDVSGGKTSSNDDNPEDTDPPPKPRKKRNSTADVDASQTVRRLPRDVQDYVAGRLEEAYPLVLSGRVADALKPLAKAARAIDRGARPRRRAR
jgi:hypothetical protein